MNIDKLKSQFTVSGEVKDFVLKKVFENEIGYIYEVRYKRGCYYEVFKKKLTPKGEYFGRWVWTLNTIQQAKDKLNQIRSNNEKNNCKSI